MIGLKTKGAVLYETGGDLIIEDLIIPPLKDGQVLVKILCSGICRSQVHEIKAHKGPDNFLPHLLGHEAVGVVEKVGNAVKKVSIGDYVVLTWIKGKGSDVPSSVYTTSSGVKVNSGAITTFNYHSVVSENRLVKISREVPINIAPLFGCAIPTGVGMIQNQLKVKKGQSIAVFGVGGIGSAALLGAVASGAHPIIAVDINDHKLELAKELGATHVINSNDDVYKIIREITDDEGVDYSVDCSGKVNIIELAFSVIKDSGITVVAGNPAKGETIRIAPFDLIRGKRIIGSWGGSTDPDVDIPRYVDQYLSGILRADLLKTTSFPLEKINEALRTFKSGDFSRVLLRTTEELN